MKHGLTPFVLEIEIDRVEIAVVVVVLAFFNGDEFLDNSKDRVLQ